MKDENSELKLNRNGNSRKTVSQRAGSKSGQVKAAKFAAELEHYRARLAENEERLRTGKASDGTPLTDLQRTKLKEIIVRQRARLLELSG